MTKSIERREAQDGTWETVVVDENGNGGSQPWIDRAPAGTITVPDHGSIVVADYYTPDVLVLEGDASLTIV